MSTQQRAKITSRLIGIFARSENKQWLRQQRGVKGADEKEAGVSDRKSSILIGRKPARQQHVQEHVRQREQTLIGNGPHAAPYPLLVLFSAGHRSLFFRRDYFVIEAIL